MLYICIGNAIVYLMTTMTGNNLLYSLLVFDKASILRGQVWRLISYPLTFSGGNIMFTAIGLLCYYSLGRAIEHQWGTLRFNLFYFTGIILMDIFCMVLPFPYCAFARADVTYLNMSLFLAYATLYPNASFLLFFIIPVKAWIFALFDILITLVGMIGTPFPLNLFPLVAIANYFLFFGKDVLNVIPLSWRIKISRLFRKNKTAPVKNAKVIQFPQSAPQQPRSTQEKANYLHKCTVCGRTDVSNPELEFRYCSRCKGYYCYCQDHISNHTHIQ